MASSENNGIGLVRNGLTVFLIAYVTIGVKADGPGLTQYLLDIG